MSTKDFLKRFPLIQRAVAFLFARTQIDETIETILGSFLETVQKLQDLADIHEATASYHEDEAAYNLTKANEHTAQANKATTIANKLSKLVS